MLLAESAILFHLKSVRVILLVLDSVVVSLLALSACQCDLNSHFGTSRNGIIYRATRWASATAKRITAAFQPPSIPKPMAMVYKQAHKKNTPNARYYSYTTHRGVSQVFFRFFRGIIKIFPPKSLSSISACAYRVVRFCAG